MSESFLNALKWYLLVGCAIIGTSAFAISNDTGSTKPVMIGVLGYGIVYIMGTFWRQFRGKLLLLSILVFVALSFLSPYIPDTIYVLFGYDLYDFNIYYLWGLTVAVFGIPIMFFVFRKYG